VHRLHVHQPTGVVRDAEVDVNGPTCLCGSCATCRNRRYWHAWRSRHPEYKRPAKPKGIPYVHPTAASMDAIAEAVWARHAAPWYYGPAAERYAARVGPMVNVHRVVAL
jgi:hypothetical protein